MYLYIIFLINIMLSCIVVKVFYWKIWINIIQKQLHLNNLID